MVGVHDARGNYEGIFVGSAQGKDSGGSLEGGVVRKHDPAITWVGVPCYGELHEVG